MEIHKTAKIDDEVIINRILDDLPYLEVSISSLRDVDIRRFVKKYISYEIYDSLCAGVFSNKADFNKSSIITKLQTLRNIAKDKKNTTSKKEKEHNYV